ncbi:MAG TPA: response regulator, partial [Kofleriaceae bacterium]|nr:response regulator [Kofleriaceae bacterium]
MTTTTRTVLIADDHVEMARLLADKLREDGWRPRVVDGGRAAIEALHAAIPDLVITDLRMAEVDGLDVLDAARAADPDLPVIIMTAFGAIETAIESMRRGAWHYVVKPVRLDELSLHVERAFEHRTLRRVNRQLRVERRLGLSALVGKSAAMRDLYALIERVGLADAADRRVGGYSGGMRRRLDLALALVHGPRVLFL